MSTVPLIYGLGLASFFLADLLTAKYGTDELVAQWASLKASLFVAIPLAMLGLDQIMIRNPNSAVRLLKLLLIQGVLIGAVIAAILIQQGMLQANATTIAAFAMLPVLQGTSAFFRSRNQFMLAQLATNGWRFFFGLLVAFTVWTSRSIDYSVLLCGAFLAGGLTLFFLYGQSKPAAKSNAKDAESSLAGYYAIGFRFGLSMVVLNASLHIEQLLLNFQQDTLSSSQYFRFCTVFLFPVTALCGLTGFVAGPYIRERAKATSEFISKYSWLVLVAAFAIAAINFVFGWVLIDYVSEPVAYKLTLAVIVSVLGMLRLLLIFPSAFLGVFAARQHLDLFVGISVLGLALMVGSYFLLSEVLNFAPVVAIGIASIVNWSTRVSAGWGLCFFISRRNNKESLSLI